MASSLNNQPSLKKEGNENGENRISMLPDSIRVHILSFLPTKYAVRTSILSSRWKHIWASVPILEFNGPLLLPSYIPFRKHNDNGRFMNFIDRVLLHDLSSIKRFSLGCNPEIDTSHLSTWIGVAIKHSVHLCYTDSLKFRRYPCRHDTTRHGVRGAGRCGLREK
ncbi:hypothetical protein CsSME_00049189 [Camellia sinensis var. sinensis]